MTSMPLVLVCLALVNPQQAEGAEASSLPAESQALQTPDASADAHEAEPASSSAVEQQTQPADADANDAAQPSSGDLGPDPEEEAEEYDDAEYEVAPTVADMGTVPAKPDEARGQRRAARAALAAGLTYAALFPFLACVVGAPCWMNNPGACLALAGGASVAAVVASLVAKRIGRRRTPVVLMVAAGVVPSWAALMLGNFAALPVLIAIFSMYWEPTDGGRNMHFSLDTMRAGARNPVTYVLAFAGITIVALHIAVASVVSAALVGYLAGFPLGMGRKAEGQRGKDADAEPAR